MDPQDVYDEAMHDYEDEREITDLDRDEPEYYEEEA